MRKRQCVCGHDRSAHEHYRSGSECALCDCGRYREQRIRTLIKGLASRFGR
jgi:hypothetical protein